MWVQSIQKVDKVDPKYASHELKIWILRIQIVDQNVDPVDPIYGTSGSKM